MRNFICFNDMAIVCCLLLFVMLGSCQNNVEPEQPEADYHYSLLVINATYNTEMVIDSVQGSISKIVSSPSWLHFVQKGNDNDNHPVMRVSITPSASGEAREGSVYLQTANGKVIHIAVTQTACLDINPGADNALSGFNKSNWRTQKTIAIYNNHAIGGWDTIALPWADVSQTSLPIKYLYPNTEKVWQLAFNLCDDKSVPGTNMFALWDSIRNCMRFYVYLDEIPNYNASSYYFVANLNTSNNSHIFDANTTGWQPSDSLLHKNWSSSIADPSLVSPNRNQITFAPISGNVTGALNPGWICYEMAFSGISKLDGKDKLDISLQSIAQSSISGSATITGTLSSIGDSSFITAPGSGMRAASVGLSTANSTLSSIASIISTIVNLGSEHVTAQKAVGFLGGIGALSGLVGGVLQTIEEAGDTKYNIDLKMNVKEKADITMTSFSSQGTTLAPVSMSVDYLFNNILQTKNSASNSNTYSIGVWNLADNPVVYVSSDALFFNGRYSEYSNWTAMGNDGIRHDAAWGGIEEPALRYATFLDPTSLNLILNSDNILFPFDKVDSVKLLAYDFVFCDDGYSLPIRPYYQFYGLECEPLPITSVVNGSFWKTLDDPNAMRRVMCKDNYLMLDTTVSPVYRSRKNSEIAKYNCTTKFAGTTLELDEDLKMYEIVMNPVLYVPVSEGSTYIMYPKNVFLENLGISVVLELTINGEKFLYAERFLPKFKSFSRNDIPELRERLYNTPTPATYEGKPYVQPLFEQQKDKALRILDLLK